jgi:hypothetical protein
MKITRQLLIVSIALFFMGCPARSFYPFFTEKNLVFNPALTGAWMDQGKKETYFFQKAEGKNYDIIVCEEKGDTSYYRGQFGQIGKGWFLDTYPSKESEDFQLVPTHIISKVWLNGDTLTFASLESEYVKGLIEIKSIKIAYTLQKEDIILTAPTEELQQLILQLAQDDKAFPNSTKLNRVK